MYASLYTLSPSCLAHESPSQPVTVPKDVHDITPLVRTIAVCGEKGILVVDPTK